MQFTGVGHEAAKSRTACFELPRPFALQVSTPWTEKTGSSAKSVPSDEFRTSRSALDPRQAVFPLLEIVQTKKRQVSPKHEQPLTLQQQEKLGSSWIKRPRETTEKPKNAEEGPENVALAKSPRQASRRTNRLLTRVFAFLAASRFHLSVRFLSKTPVQARQVGSVVRVRAGQKLSGFACLMARNFIPGESFRGQPKFRGTSCSAPSRFQSDFTSSYNPDPDLSTNTKRLCRCE